MIHLGNIPASTTLYIPFATFDSNGASVTISGLALGDILIYKNGSTTQRASTAGFTLLDTDGIDFDGITGIHGFSIDLSDNTDAGFYAAGATYWVVVSTITVSAQTVSFVAATFRIVAAENTSGTPVADTVRLSGTTQTARDIGASVLLASSQLFVKKNTQLSSFMFVMTDSTTHAPKTGVVVTATRSIDGAAFGACANAVSELSNGVYTITLAAADLNGTNIMLRFTGASSDDVLIQIVTQA